MNVEIEATGLSRQVVDKKKYLSHVCPLFVIGEESSQSVSVDLNTPYEEVLVPGRRPNNSDCCTETDSNRLLTSSARIRFLSLEKSSPAKRIDFEVETFSSLTSMAYMSYWPTVTLHATNPHWAASIDCSECSGRPRDRGSLSLSRREAAPVGTVEARATAGNPGRNLAASTIL